MKQTENIDELINQYSSELLDFAKINNHMYDDYSIADTDEKKRDNSNKENYEMQTETTDESTAEEQRITENDLPQENAEDIQTDNTDGEISEHEENLFFPRSLPEEETELPEEKTNEAEIDSPVANPENFAYFTGRIFAAEGALPVEGAKVIVKKDGEIYAYLLTDGSGETKTVKLEANPKENSLEPYDTNKQMIYTADIYAEGFESKRNLLVEATGGSVVVLQQFMVPVQQGG